MVPTLSQILHENGIEDKHPPDYKLRLYAGLLGGGVIVQAPRRRYGLVVTGLSHGPRHSMIFEDEIK